jgi:predicted kinase
LAAANAAEGPASPEVTEARDYLRRALAYLDPPPARLVALGGVSGTGKSTLARQLAPPLGPAPGAAILRSDVVRKRLHGVTPGERLPPEAYRKEASRTVYDALAARAAALVRAGHATIVDAMFLDPEERAQIERVATDAGVRFQALWLTAPEHVLVQRLTARRGDVSDATPDVLRAQLATDPGALTWPMLDVSGSPQEVAAQARALLGLP